MLIDEHNRVSQAGEQRYRHLFENVPICIFVVDLTVTPAIILDVNRQAELVYGYTAAELVGNPAVYLVPEESRASVEKSLRRAQRGETVTSETTNRHRDGTHFPVRVIATLDPTESGRMFIVVKDITAETQRRSESEAIERERLRIAHEIHDGIAQDLAGLRLKSALWQQLIDVDPLGIHAALDELQAALNAAIHNLRRAIFALRPADLEALGFFQALAQLAGSFGEYNQLVTQLKVTGLKDKLPAAYELPLFRIIQEGLNNIHQHAHASSAFVGLTVNSLGGVMVLVRDNGRGFNSNQVGRAEHSGRFGLRQMRERIHELGGTLDIHSVMGQGTELFITLPPIAKEATISGKKELTMPTIKILIADDHTLMRQGLRQLCEGLGNFMVVAEAENGAQAVNLVPSTHPDVILMDIVMPDMNGAEAIRHIIHDTPPSRIIALTMYREEKFMLDAVRAGARGYLLKTVDACDLIAAIEAVHRGEYLIDPIIAARVLSELHLPVSESSKVEPLTGGEMAVLRLVAQGVENQDIAQALNYSVYTVANRLRTIYEKLHVTNRTQAALYALRQGWATLDKPPVQTQTSPFSHYKFL